MQAIVNTGPGRLELLEIPCPAPGAGQVRVRVRAVGICATDLQMIAGWERTGFPATPGHEWCGVIDAIGPGCDAELIGRLCVAENVLADGGEVGFEHPGGYGEYLITEASNVHVLPDGFDPVVGAMIEPLAVCVRGLSRLRRDVRGPALVLGDGPIGLLMTLLLRRAGVEPITVVGGRPERLELAARFGAERTVNYHACAEPLEAALTQPGCHFATVVEASGAGHAAEAALHVAARTGRVLLLGDYGHSTAGFRWLHLLLREIEIIGSNASADAWPEAVRLATVDGLPIGDIVTHRLPAESYRDALDLVRDRRAGAVKVALTW